MQEVLIIYDRADLKKNEWFVNRCREVFRKHKLETAVIIADEFTSGVFENKPVFVINRSRKSGISEYFESLGIRVYNSALVTEIGNDKWKTYLFAKKHDIDVLETDTVEMDYPQVVKSRAGHGGSEVHLVHDRQELEALPEYEEGRIFQKLADAHGVDIRVYVLGEKIVAAIKRKAGDDFRSNYSLGGETSLYELDDRERAFVERVISVLKPDYVGIDIMYDGERLILNEIEDAAGARMLYENSDVDIVGDFAKYCVKNTLFTECIKVC